MIDKAQLSVALSTTEMDSGTNFHTEYPEAHFK